MAKFAPVAPIWLLDQLLDDGLTTVGDYHLLLAHDVLENENRFASWTQKLRERYSRLSIGREPVIIMDNSVIELGSTVPLIDIVQAANVVKANVIVLPDHIGDHKATLSYIDQAEDELGISDGHELPFDVMFVPQGNTLDEYIASMEYVANRHWIQWLGLPRDALKFMTSRTLLLDAATIVCPHKLIHLLGFSDNLLDDFTCCAHPMVYGIDSAVPVRAGMKGVEFKLSNSDYGKREDFWTNEKPLNDLTINNIAKARRWTNSNELSIKEQRRLCRVK